MNFNIDDVLDTVMDFRSYYNHDAGARDRLVALVKTVIGKIVVYLQRYEGTAAEMLVDDAAEEDAGDKFFRAQATPDLINSGDSGGRDTAAMLEQQQEYSQIRDNGSSEEGPIDLFAKEMQGVFKQEEKPCQ